MKKLLFSVIVLSLCAFLLVGCSFVDEIKNMIGSFGDNTGDNTGDDTGDTDDNTDDGSCKHEDTRVLRARVATCEKTGLTEGVKCNDCKEIIVEQDIIPALGHTEVIREGKEATCIEEGLTEGKYCSVCKTEYVTQEIIEMTSHTEVIDDGFAATASTAGLTNGRHCSVCDKVLVAQRIIPILSENLSNYTLYTVGDSLCAPGKWQYKVAELTGVTFDQSINSGSLTPTSMGGTNSDMSDGSSTFFRVMNLINSGSIQGDGENALVVFENVNDGQFVFDPNARSYRMDNIINVEKLTETHLSFIDASQRSLNTVLAVNTVAAGKELVIKELPSKEGDVSITVGWAGPGTRTYNIHVAPSMDVSDIMDLILEISYYSIYDIAYSDNSVAFTSGMGGNREASVEFLDKGNTGMIVEINSISDATYQKHYWYNSDDLSDWTNVDNWVLPSTSSGWKSSIELLLETYPKIQIAILNLPRISVTQADYLKADGTYDEERFNSDLKDWKNSLQARCSAIAEYYDLILIDSWAKSNITASNLTDYYYDTANVHPKNEGYLMLGEVIANELLNSDRLIYKPEDN